MSNKCEVLFSAMFPLIKKKKINYYIISVLLKILQLVLNTQDFKLTYLRHVFRKIDISPFQGLEDYYNFENDKGRVHCSR